MNELMLTIVTPDGITFNEAVEMVTLPGAEGELGILTGHEPLMTRMVAGELTAHMKDKNRYFAVSDGMVEITGGKVSILTGMAIPAESIDVVKAEEVRREAEARLNDRMSAEEVATVNAALVKAIVQIQVKQRHRF